MGALDAWLTPIIMKKGRPATKLEVLAPLDRVTRLENMILQETSTIGLRKMPMLPSHSAAPESGRWRQNTAPFESNGWNCPMARRASYRNTKIAERGAAAKSVPVVRSVSGDAGSGVGWMKRFSTGRRTVSSRINISSIEPFDPALIKQSEFGDGAVLIGGPLQGFNGCRGGLSCKILLQVDL